MNMTIVYIKLVFKKNIKFQVNKLTGAAADDIYQNCLGQNSSKSAYCNTTTTKTIYIIILSCLALPSGCQLYCNFVKIKYKLSRHRLF